MTVPETIPPISKFCPSPRKRSKSSEPPSAVTTEMSSSSLTSNSRSRLRSTMLVRLGPRPSRGSRGDAGQDGLKPRPLERIAGDRTPEQSKVKGETAHHRSREGWGDAIRHYSGFHGEDNARLAVEVGPLRFLGFHALGSGSCPTSARSSPTELSSREAHHM